MPVNIEIQNQQTKIPIPIPRLKKVIRNVLKAEKIKDADLSFVFISDRKIRAVNRKYLQHDYATDVLTFDFASPGAKHKKNSLAGEIIISAQTAARNAKSYDSKTRDELILYMIHGILHLLGYDDHSSADITRMRKKENVLLSKSNL